MLLISKFLCSVQYYLFISRTVSEFYHTTHKSWVFFGTLGSLTILLLQLLFLFDGLGVCVSDCTFCILSRYVLMIQFHLQFYLLLILLNIMFLHRWEDFS